MKLIKVIFNILLFTLILESVEGRKLTHTEFINGSSMDMEAVVIKELFERNGKLALISEIEYKFVDFEKLTREEGMELAKTREFFYKYWEDNSRIENGELIEEHKYYHQNGNIWVRKKIVGNRTTTECWEENGNQIKNLTLERLNNDCDAKRTKSED
tara:strand:+ start:119 stop:589 length:471 start_codon:yes stop_codon:yes gene_type:complete